MGDRAVGGGCRMARRWGLCHSERHTYGAMKGLLQRRFSRVAVRGAAKVRLRALQAITGRIQGRFEVEEGKFYSAEILLPRVVDPNSRPTASPTPTRSMTSRLAAPES